MVYPEEPVDGAQSDRNQLDGVVRSIGDHARTVNLSRAAGLSTAIDQAGSGQLADSERFAAAEVAHQLVGSAGTFGFSGASALAAELEHFFTDADFGASRLAVARQQLTSLFEQLNAEPEL